MNKSLSQTISFLRFPLIIGVVFIHTVFFLPEKLEGYEIFRYMLGCLTAFAVPVFFGSSVKCVDSYHAVHIVLI